jgi:hypothetical protein
MSVLFLLGAVVCVSAVPPVDLPETSFNEADTPVNLTLPAQTTIKVVCPPGDRIVVRSLPPCRADYVVSSSALEPAAMLSQRHRHSRQDLLCSFLI